MTPKDVTQIVGIVKIIEERKRSQKRAPIHAMMTEVIAESPYTGIRTRELLRFAVNHNLLRFDKSINEYFFTTE